MDVLPPPPLPSPGSAQERLRLAARLFDDAMAIPVQLPSDTDDTAMAVDATPFTNSIPKVDHWEQSVFGGKKWQE